jgi:hypothetical protein
MYIKAPNNVLKTMFSDEETRLRQGCQIFLGTTYQKGENIPNYHKIYRMHIKYTKIAVK